METEALVLAPTCAFLFGFCSGAITRSKLASRQFLAENAHRLPSTMPGWYFYQKTKNYRVLLGAARGGARTGGALALWTLAFVALQQGVNEALVRAVVTPPSSSSSSAPTSSGELKTAAKLAGGAVAGLGLAIAAHSIYGLSRAGRVRRTLMGTTIGTSVGALQIVRDRLAARREALLAT